MSTYTKTHTFIILGTLLIIGLLPALTHADGSNRSDVAKEKVAAMCEKLEARGHEHRSPFCGTENDGGDGGEGGDDGGDEPSVSVNHLLISEVLYDLENDGSQGSESGGDNEWVEIHNPTNVAVDLAGWSIGVDVVSGDSISQTELIIEPGAFLVITDAESTADFWDFTTVDVVYLGSSISGGLRNGGDTVALFNSSEVMVDSVSWGDDTTAFNPAVVGGTDGTSISRSELSTDTDTAADWVVAEVPTPGM